MINERDIDFDRLADTGIGEMFCHSFAIGFIRQLFADLRQIVLTLGIVDVG